MGKKILFLLISAIILSGVSPISSSAQEDPRCDTFSVSPKSGASNTPFAISATGCLTFATYIIGLEGPDGETVSGPGQITSDANGNIQTTVSGYTDDGTYTAFLLYGNDILSTDTFSITGFIKPKCGDVVPANSLLCPSECPSVQVGSVWKCEGTGPKEVSRGGEYYCDAQGNPTSVQTGKLFTALGCIPISDPNAFVGFILRWGIGIGGGIAFLLILYAGFMIMTSTGDPQRLKAGQELLTSAIAGVILLVFSIFILRLIGVDILQIPGFGR